MYGKPEAPRPKKLPGWAENNLRAGSTVWVPKNKQVPYVERVQNELPKGNWYTRASLIKTQTAPYSPPAFLLGPFLLCPSALFSSYLVI